MEEELYLENRIEKHWNSRYEKCKICHRWGHYTEDCFQNKERSADNARYRSNINRNPTPVFYANKNITNNTQNRDNIRPPFRNYGPTFRNDRPPIRNDSRNREDSGNLRDYQRNRTNYIRQIQKQRGPIHARIPEIIADDRRTLKNERRVPEYTRNRNNYARETEKKRVILPVKRHK